MSSAALGRGARTTRGLRVCAHRRSTKTCVVSEHVLRKAGSLGLGGYPARFFTARMPSAKRKQPNILITGTPGVGKSTLARRLADETGLVWREVSKLAIDNKCLEEYDDVYKCPILDEDKLLDSMEDHMSDGGNIVDYHGADFFPERWFDLVVVLRTSNTILYDRLTARGYQGRKLEDNIDCEIFQTILEEAKASYRDEIVTELESNNEQQMNDNVARIVGWLEQWTKDNP